VPESPMSRQDDGPPARTPRVEPLTRAEYVKLRERLGSEPVSAVDADLHISRTWARNPELMLAQTPLQSYFMTETALPPRIREIAILRIGWLCSSDYEFGQHSVFGRNAGLTEDEIARLAAPDPGAAWPTAERAVITAVDEMHSRHDISDPTWSALAGHFTPAALIDLVALVGRYWTVSVMTNALRVALEPGRRGIPSRTAPADEPT
jgi:4-carboxymuconolactone decarboxylase